jgi:sugar phosphate isomerase/epimerase
MKISKVLTVVLVVMITVLLLTAANVPAAEKKISFTKYPGFKLGFTSVIFTKCGMGPTVENAVAFIDLASDMGFSWVELRDPNATLKVGECKAIAAYAKAKNIELAYAANFGPLDPNFWQVLGNSWRNAQVFTSGPKSVRVTDGFAEFNKDANKKSWTEAEFNQAVANLNAAAIGVKDLGLQLMVENANLPVKGQFGFEDLMAKVDPAVAYQYDSANMFSASRVKTDPKDAEQVFTKLAPRIVYTHLKTSIDGVAQLTITNNETNLDTVIATLGKNNKNYIALELAQADTYEDQVENLVKSLDFLKSKGFIK